MASKLEQRIGTGPPSGTSWFWVQTEMARSLTFRALGMTARHILDFLLCENTAHGGLENGNLAAPYAQLEAFGCTLDDIRKGFEELFVTGFVVKTAVGQRVADGGEPARYRLSWLPYRAAGPTVSRRHIQQRVAELSRQTDEWKTVLADIDTLGVHDVRAVRKWLREMTREFSRSRRRVVDIDCEANPSNAPP